MVRDGIWRRGLSAFVVAAWAAVGVGGAQEVAGPRALSAAEREALVLALGYLEEGPGAWWAQLAADSPLRALGREVALAEIAVRAGPPAGATWTLQTPDLRYGDAVAILAIEMASGFEEVLFLRFEEEQGWKLSEVRSMVDPPLLREPLPEFLRRRPEMAGGRGSSPGSGGAWLSVLVAVLLFGWWRLRGPALGAGLLAAGLVVLVACRGEGGPVAEEEEEGGLEAVPRLGSLLPYREALAGASGEAPDTLYRKVPRTGEAYAAAQLWKAQDLLAKSQLNPADKILAGFPRPAERPLTALLRGRLGLLRADPDGSLASYEHLLNDLSDTDGLHLEAAEASVLLGLDLQFFLNLARVGDRGARLAEVYYDLAKYALYDSRQEEAEHYFRLAWAQKPIPRRELFGDPLLASLAAIPRLYDGFHFGSREEPVVTPDRWAETPLPLPEGARSTLLGSELTVELGGAILVVPGGAEVAPTDTPLENAATRAERRQREALEQLPTLVELAREGALLARPRERRLAAAATTALGERHRWGEVLELTEGLSGHLGSAPPVLVQLRARALREEDRQAEARDLLVRLAQSDIANRRRDPATFYQLAELLALSGDFDRAIRLLEKADSLSPLTLGAGRIRQLRMEAELVSSYQEHSTEHFDLKYPRATGARYPRQLGMVLEEEYRRLRRWIPVDSAARVEVHLLPLRQFLRAYSTGVLVLGLYDGRVRVPLADLKSLDPVIVALLSHELAHAMITEATDDRAPRWLQEGLAQHVQMVSDFLNPFQELHESGRLLAFPVVDTVLEGFGEAQLVEIAYSEAAWLVHYIETEYGVRGIHRLLRAFREGGTTEQAVDRALGVSSAELEAGAWRWGITVAPAVWPTEVRRYDQELDGLVQRAERAERRATPSLVVTERSDPAKQRQELRRKMGIWHRRYAAAVADVRGNLGPVIGAFRGQGRQPADLATTCGRLRAALAPVLGEPAIFGSPDRNVGRSLHLAYQRFDALATACLEGRISEATAHLRQAEAALGEAAKRLAVYGLQP